jgi:hypothetical protein
MSRSPDYRIGAMNKRTDEKNGKVGAAWINNDGSISLVLDTFVQLPVGSPDLLITLFPATKEKE